MLPRGVLDEARQCTAVSVWHLRVWWAVGSWAWSSGEGMAPKPRKKRGPQGEMEGEGRKGSGSPGAALGPHGPT